MQVHLTKPCLVIACCAVLVSCGDSGADRDASSAPTDQGLAEPAVSDLPATAQPSASATGDTASPGGERTANGERLDVPIDLETATQEEAASFFGIEIPTHPSAVAANTDPAAPQGQVGQDLIADYERKLEAALKQLEQAKAELAQARAEQRASQGQAVSPEPAVFLPPPDRIEPFMQGFGFGDPERVSHYWSWAQNWEFTDMHAVNTQRPGGAVLESRYKLMGDFQITCKGRLSKSWSNSRRSVFEVCGQQIGLANWRPVGIDLTVKREGDQLTYSLSGQEPVVVALTEDQAGPAQARLVVYGRHATIEQLELVADSAQRIVE